MQKKKKNSFFIEESLNYFHLEPKTLSPHSLSFYSKERWVNLSKICLVRSTVERKS